MITYFQLIPTTVLITRQRFALSSKKSYLNTFIELQDLQLSSIFVKCRDNQISYFCDLLGPNKTLLILISKLNILNWNNWHCNIFKIQNRLLNFKHKNNILGCLLFCAKFCAKKMLRINYNFTGHKHRYYIFIIIIILMNVIDYYCKNIESFNNVS